MFSNSKLRAVKVESAGTFVRLHSNITPGSSPLLSAIQCLEKRGIAITGHKSRQVSPSNINTFDIIICLSLVEMTYISYMRPRGAIILAEVPEPLDDSPPSFESCADGMEAFAKEFIKTYL
jgi:protein-tyrosine-phosphatase